MSQGTTSKLVVLYLSFLHSLNHCLHMSLPAIIPLIIAEGFRYDEVGSAVALSMFLYGGGALMAGHLAAKLGEKKGIFISIFLQGASCLLVFIHGPLGLFSFLASLGFFGSFYHPLSYSYIYGRFEKKAGEAMGLHGVGANIGQIAYPAVALLIALTFGWRCSIIFFGSVLILASFAVLSLPSNPPYYKKPVIPLYLEIISNKAFLLVLLFAISFGLYFRGIELYLPSYLKSVKGFEIIAAGISSSVLLAGGALGQYLGGRIGDRRGPEFVFVIMATVGLLSLLSLQITYSLVIIMTFVFLFGLSFYGQQPACNLYLAKKFGKEILAITYGIWFFMSFSFMALSTFIAGRIIQIYGFNLLLVLSSGISLFVLFLSLYIFKKERG